MFKKILIANRGEIACRIIKSAKELGIQTVAVFSDADKKALHTRLADEAINIGPAESKLSYLSIDKVLAACETSGADAVHPGYGFLSENSTFAEKLSERKIAFIGPPAEAIKAMGDKITSKKIASEANVSTIPGFMGIVKNVEHAIEISSEIGFPVMIKASAGGGGKGMRIANSAEEVLEGFKSSQNEAEKSFGDNRMFIEKFISKPRHIEIQILGDKHGNFVFLGERECSVQRRNQKVIEEAPSPFLQDKVREKMGAQAISLAKAVNYFSVGTVEFIVDKEQNFYFLEMNTRLQVEHPITELVYGVDLVEEMIKIAWGAELQFKQPEIAPNGWAIESRIYAEDPCRNFLPSAGRLSKYRPPRPIKTQNESIRNDTGVYEGGEISIYYDPMISKLCSWALDRQKALNLMKEALDDFEIEGIVSNLSFLSSVLDNKKFVLGDYNTAFIGEEYVEGFKNDNPNAVTSEKLAAIAGCVSTIIDHRNEVASSLQGINETLQKYLIVVQLEIQYELQIVFSQKKFLVRLNKDKEFLIETDWLPGGTLIRARINKEIMTIKLKLIKNFFQLSYRGSLINSFVYSVREAELAKLMIEKKEKETSSFLICPMPGLLVSLNVVPGDKVSTGQAVCVVEAMKMENVLRAEKSGRVKTIHKNMGDSLSVDEIIMEFD